MPSDGQIQNDSLVFTFEINRHGARAPYYTGSDEIALKGYTVGIEQLTPMGMRQRMLLGRYNRETSFNNSFCICDEKPRAFIESTDVYRTMQSAYAEMSGQYPMPDKCC